MHRELTSDEGDGKSDLSDSNWMYLRPMLARGEMPFHGTRKLPKKRSAMCSMGRTGVQICATGAPFFGLLPCLVACQLWTDALADCLGSSGWSTLRLRLGSLQLQLSSSSEAGSRCALAHYRPSDPGRGGRRRWAEADCWP